MSYSCVSEILPGIWLGDTTSVQDGKFLMDKHVEFIINCSEEQNYPNNPNIKVKYRYKMGVSVLDEYVTLINTNINSYNILVYGNPILIVAYIMKYGNINLVRTIELMETKRSGIGKDVQNNGSLLILRRYNELSLNNK